MEGLLPSLLELRRRFCKASGAGAWMSLVCGGSWLTGAAWELVDEEPREEEEEEEEEEGGFWLLLREGQPRVKLLRDVESFQRTVFFQLLSQGRA